MNDPRPKSRLAPALLVVGILCGLLAGYVLSYFILMDDASTKVFVEQGSSRERYFGPMWLCAFYSPAARVEAVTTGSMVSLISLEESETYDMYPNYDDWLSVYFHRMIIPENARKAGWWWP
jgi:hypothetical protein